MCAATYAQGCTDHEDHITINTDTDCNHNDSLCYVLNHDAQLMSPNDTVATCSVNVMPVVETVETVEATVALHAYLTSLISKYCKNLLMAHVNINSIRNKFDYIEGILSTGLLDFISISETKLDSSFTNCQFSCSGYIVHQNDSTHRSGGLMTYIRTIYHIVDELISSQMITIYNF